MAKQFNLISKINKNKFKNQPFVPINTINQNVKNVKNDKKN